LILAAPGAFANGGKSLRRRPSRAFILGIGQ
jgi:hypothetical protein